MLSKLFRYEMKSTARIFLPIWGAILLLSIVNRLTLSFLSGLPYLQIPQTLLMILYIVLLIGSIVLSIIVMIQRFYKNLLGAEGYLMFTLPVKAGSNILAKAFAAIIWIFGTFLIALCSVLIMVLDSVSLTGFFESWNRIYLSGLESGIDWNLTICLFLILFCLGVVAFVFQAYASMAIGQLSNNHKLLCSFGAYLGFYLAIQTLVMVAMAAFAVVYGNNFTNAFLPGRMGTLVYPFLISEIILYLAEIIGFYFLSRYLLSHRLNLE